MFTKVHKKETSIFEKNILLPLTSLLVCDVHLIFYGSLAIKTLQTPVVILNMNKASRNLALISFLVSCGLLFSRDVVAAKNQKIFSPSPSINLINIDRTDKYPALNQITSQNISDALLWVFQQKEPIMTELNQDSYQLYSPNQSFVLQIVFDWINFHLMNTSLGNAIITQLLHCQEQLIKEHLGVSPEAAQQINAKTCVLHSTHAFIKDDWAIYMDVIKNGRQILKSQNPRKFIILTTQQDIPYSSWTYPTSNITSIIIHSSDMNSSLVSLLFQVIAHELMIHFDSKSWLASDSQNPSPVDDILKQFFVNNNDLRSVQTVLSNPLLSTVLSYMRAFRGEFTMISELPKSIINIDLQVEYDPNLYPFLWSHCDWNCLYDYIAHQTKALTPLALPLVSFSPLYRYLKLSKLNLDIDTQFSPLNDLHNEAVRSLNEYPKKYLNLISGMNFINQVIAFITIPDKPDHMWQSVSSIFGQLFIPSELNWLCTFQSQEANKKLINEMIQPILSILTAGTGIGPRPVIRGGGH